MSWSIGPLVVTAENSVEKIEAAAEAFIVGYNDTDEGKQATAEHMSAAGDAVDDLLTSGVLGNGEFKVTLSGHANPGHEKRVGWADDYISIRVEQT